MPCYLLGHNRLYPVLFLETGNIPKMKRMNAQAENGTVSRGRMNRLSQQRYEASSFHLMDRVSLAGWGVSVAVGLALWAALFSLA